MLLRTKNTFICVLVLLSVILFAALGAIGFAQSGKTAYATATNTQSIDFGSDGITFSYIDKAIASYEVTIGETTTKYVTIEEAWVAANEADSATVKMFNDAEISSPLQVENAKTITFDLNGYVLSGSDSLTSSIFHVPADTTLILKDGNSSGTGNIIGKNAKAVMVYGSFVMESGKISGGMHGGVWLDNALGTFTMNGGKISDNTLSSDEGAGVSVTRGTFIMNGGEISNNTCKYNGGGVYLSGGSTFTMNNGSIANNKSNGNGGGGIYIGSGRNTFNMYGGSITGNSAQFGDGGALQMLGGTFNLKGKVNISGNGNNGMSNNIYLFNYTYITIVGAIEAGSIISINGCTSGSEYVVENYDKTEQGAEYTKYFKTDRENSCLALWLNTYIRFGQHAATESWLSDTGKNAHYRLCKNECGARFDEAEHTAEADDKDCTTSTNCSVCNEVIESAPATTHDLQYVAEADGKHRQVCQNNGCEHSTEPENCTFGVWSGNAEGHTRSCNYCGNEQNESHVEGEPKRQNEIAASCSQYGSYDEVLCCVSCDYEISRTKKTIEMTAHTYGEWETAKAPTCSAVGSKKHICTVCKHEEAEDIAIDADAHAWNDGVITKQPTCIATGVKTSTCALDPAHTKTEDIAIDDDAHSFGEWTESEPADCTHKGEETRVCAHNSEHKETRETDPLGHAWNSESVRIEPTCTTEGSVTGTCTVCGETDTEILVELGHDLEQHEARAATCTQIGWYAYVTCSRCDHTNYDEIPALGHDLKHVDRADATTTANGHIEHWTCSVCEKQYTDESGATEIDSVVIPMLKTELVKPDVNGGEHEVVVTTPNGFKSDIELVVTEISRENFSQYDSIAQTVNGKVDFVYDITLKSDGVTVQPDGTLTIKLHIPETLQGKNFKLFHLHGSEATDMEYDVDGSYAVVNTDRLSEFIFVGEKSVIKDADGGLSAGAIAGITIAVIVVVLLAAYVALYFTLYRKGGLKGKAFDVIYAPMNAIFDKKEKKQ